MDFEERVKFLRKHPNFMVVPEVEIKAVAFSCREKNRPEKGDFVVDKTSNGVLVLKQIDIEKIVREYPDLAVKLRQTDSELA